MSDIIDRQPIHPYRRHIALEPAKHRCMPTEEQRRQNDARIRIERLREDERLLSEMEDGFGLMGTMKG